MEDPRHWNVFFFSPPGKCCEICSLCNFWMWFTLSPFLCETWWSNVGHSKQFHIPDQLSSNVLFKVLFICSEPNKNLGIWLKKMEKGKHDMIASCHTVVVVQSWLRLSPGTLSTFHSSPLTLLCKCKFTFVWIKCLLHWRHIRVVIKVEAYELCGFLKFLKWN